MRDLKRVKKVEKTINEIKAMSLSLPEKMYYIYTLFLEDFTDEMKNDLQTDIKLNEKLKKLSKKKNQKSKEKLKELKTEIEKRDQEISQKLPALVARIKTEVNEYADIHEAQKWTKKEDEKRLQEADKIDAIKNRISSS